MLFLQSIYRYRLFTVIVLLAITILGYSQGRFFRFDKVTSEEGLSQSAVYTIAQDTKGYIWLGTRNGLNKYDGFRMTLYKHSEKDLNSLCDDGVNVLLCDSKGRLWIGTNKGLNLYNPGSDNFTQIASDSLNDYSLTHSTVTQIYEDRTGNIWVGTRNGLNFLEPESDKYKVTHFLKSNDLTNNQVLDIYQDKNNVYWLGTNHGLYCFDFSGNKIRNLRLFQHMESNPNSLSHDIVNSLCEDGKGNLWVATERGGLNIIDLKTTHITSKNNSSMKILNQVESTVRKIKPDSRGNLLIGTIAGFYVLNLVSGDFNHLKNDFNDPESLNDNSIRSIFIDKDGTYWLGTYYGGISLYNPMNKQFRNIRPSILGTRLAAAIYKDRQNNFWLGTNGGGLVCWNPVTKTYITYKNQVVDPNSITNNTIKCISPNGDQGLWIGTLGGMDYFNFRDKKFTHYRTTLSNLNSLREGYIYNVLNEKGDLWIANFDNGLCKYAGREDKFYFYKFNPANKYSISSNNVTCVFRDSRGTLWVGTTSGLNKMIGPNKFERYFYKVNSASTLNENYINCIIEDKKGNLWIGTLQNGFYVLSITTGDIKHYNRNNGLPGDNIWGILEDNKGMFWISTDNGLLKFNPTSGRFIHYNKFDGLICSEFNFNSYFKDHQGNMYFGGQNGIVYFHPDSIIENNIIPPVYFLKLVTVTGNGENSKPISDVKSIELKHNQNIFTVHFAVLNYINSKKNKYAYKLVGFNDDWRIIDRPSVTLMNLRHGKYILHVKGSNNDGVWNETGASMEVIILPPWWQTWWFKLFFNLAVFGVISYFFYKTILKIKRSANQTILDERNQLKTLINNIPDLIFIKDKNLRFVIANNQAIKFLGLEEEKSIIGRTDFDFYPPHMAEKFYSQEMDIIKTGEPLINKEEEREANGQKAYYSVTKSPIINSRNGKIGLVIIVYDITAQKRAQLEIVRQSEELKHFNKELYQVNNQLAERQQQIEKQSEELRIYGDNLKVANDLLTARQELIEVQAEQLKKTNTELSVMNSTKDRFFSIIAHDLRNPFHTLIGFSEILLTEFDELTPDIIRKYLGMIYSTSIGGNNLLENLLQWSRTQTGRISFEPVKLQLELIVQEVVNLLYSNAIQKKIELHQSVDSGIVVFSDTNMLRTILRNLISNAIKFTPENGKITILAKHTNDAVEVTVADNGVGMCEEVQKQLFRIDSNISTKGTSDETGTGLGLILCKEFVERNHGKIWAESEPGKGSRFKFTLPRA